MNPNYIHTITLYQKKSDGAWARTVLHHCFWKSEIIITQAGTSEAKKNAYTVRLPLKETGAGFRVNSGDIVIHGECREQITDKSPYTATEVMQRHKPDAFRVTAVSDNTAFPVSKHYRLGG